MTDQPARAGSGWLALREPADGAARSAELVGEVRSYLPAGREVTIYDLGCGTGSMARWLAPQLSGPQRWLMYDRDVELLDLVAAQPDLAAADGAPVLVEARRGDITRLDTQELEGANLITASALLDMMTADELDRLVTRCAGVGCPVLITLSVVGRVDLVPPEPFDQAVGEAFNAHQRRMTSHGRLLGPDAVGAAVGGFGRLGRDVLVRSSPWRLGPDQSDLTAQWFTGWLAAACEQQPALDDEALAYAQRRLAQAAAGELSVTVQHEDLLVRPA